MYSNNTFIKFRCFFALILLFFNAKASLAQSVSISGAVVDLLDRPIDAATVNLVNSADSALIKAELSGADGRYQFSGIKPGVYRVAVSMIGFERFMSDPLEARTDGFTVDFPTIRLRESAAALKEVTVTAQKPFLERRNDRLIVNVESSIMAAGSSAMEVLERAPGVIVSASDAISIRGRAGVIVMIDGKPTPMSGQELANYLRALPANSIDRIEIITNPSAKYDAAGNAGIIDIRMKKDKNLGTNGSATVNYGQGVYPKAGGGFNLNYRNKKVNVFGGYNYNFRKGMNDLRLYREFFENGTRTGAYDQRNYLVMPNHFHTVRFGSDFFINKKTVIGFVASGTVHHFKPRGENTSTVENGPGEKISAFGTSNRSKDLWPNYGFNGNFKHSFNQQGRELTVDVDYARFWNQTDQNFTTRYYDLQGVENQPLYLLVGDLAGNLQIRSAKADYTHPVGEKAKVEAGLKSSVVNADNNVQFFDKSNPENPVYDSTISNHFLYRENINAAYLNLSREWDKFSIQAGLRAENTRAEGEQLVNGTSFDRNYVNWFPSAFLTYKFSPKYEMGLNMSRRLDRPSYQQLNPFKFYLDPSTYREGNPYLNPQFTWSFEWNHTIAQRFNFTLAYASTSDNITQVIGPVEGVERVTVQTDRNLARVEYFSFGGSATINPFKWWSSTNNLNAWQGRYRGTFANTTLNDGNLVMHYTTNNTFTFKNNWSSELNFTYKTSELYGFMDLNPMWGLGFGVQKQFFDRKATVKVAFTDVFWTNLPSAVITYRDYVETFDVYRETRQATVAMTYRFGNKQVAQSRRRQGGAEEEKRRAGGQG